MICTHRITYNSNKFTQLLLYFIVVMQSPVKESSYSVKTNSEKVHRAYINGMSNLGYEECLYLLGLSCLE